LLFNRIGWALQVSSTTGQAGTVTWVYIVTGASAGIGRATAEAFIERGVDVMVVARRLDLLQELKARSPERVRIVQADLGSAQDQAALIAEAKQYTISGLIHAAGSSIVPTSYCDLDPEVLLSDMAVHVGAPLALNRGLHRNLAGGRVVYIDSFSATTLRQGWSGYSTVKAAAQMAARAAAHELSGVTVIRLFPGGVRTALVEQVLASAESSPAVEAFRALEERGELVEPGAVGTFISQVVLDGSSEELAARETWDFTNPSDRIFS